VNVRVFEQNCSHTSMRSRP